MPQCTLWQNLYVSNAGFEHEIALEYFGNRIKYKDLFKNIESVEQAFISYGIKKGQIVTICSLNIPETVYVIYALNRIGAIANLEYPTLSEDKMYEVLSDSNCSCFVCLSLFENQYKDANKYVDYKIILSPTDSMPKLLAELLKLKHRFSGNGSMVRAQNTIRYNEFVKRGIVCKNSSLNYEHDGTAVIVHTGGTTGVPKGVLLTNDNFNAIVHEYSKCGMVYHRQDTLLHGIPPFHAYGFSIGIHMPLCLGMTVILSIKVDYDEVTKLFEKVKPVHFVGGAAHTVSIINKYRNEKSDLSHMSIFAIGGSSLDSNQRKQIEEFMKKHNANIHAVTGYGMSELCATACTERNDCYRDGSVGVPFPNVNVKVVGDHNEELIYGEMGEIYISSPGLMKAYTDSDETEKVIEIDENGERWIKTGDLGYVDKDGFVFLTGRIKRIYPVKINGAMYKLFPDYV